jgi:hypothetical protein
MILTQPFLLSLAFSAPKEKVPSKWARRTAKKRERVNDLLTALTPPPLLFPGAGPLDRIDIINFQAPSIDWVSYPEVDPVASGKLQPDTTRARRKRRQVEAFVHVCKEITRATRQHNNDVEVEKGQTCIIDCGSGAGNLSIPLHELVGGVLAIDVNDIALLRLKARCPSLQTLCTDLASDITLPPNAAIVTSLHACGAATDLSIGLAIRNNLPFCMSPCCTAKAIVTRNVNVKYGPNVSSQRSGAPDTITYPRSVWLTEQLLNPASDYSNLAKIADLGLGPQITVEQRAHQSLAKLTIELDRLVGVAEQTDYLVRLVRIRDHEDYGKAELLLGAPRDSEAARVIQDLF